MSPFRDGRAVGYIVTFAKDGGQFVENFAVDPARHGDGVGRALMAFTETQARRAGLNRLFLYTNIHMTENLDFYPRLGYVETHRVREDGFDRVYFEKRLSP
ncbi:MAG: GNAT family N-acetyltransferase [Rhodospirillaceae bacterium]